MKKQLLNLCWMLSFWVCALGVQAQSVDYTLVYNPMTNEYEAYARPDFTQMGFIVGGGSQFSLVLPPSVPDAALTITSVNGGTWTDNSQLFAPDASANVDFHSITSLGGVMNLTANTEVLLFTFSLANPDCLPGVRIFTNGVDPDSSVPFMLGTDFENAFLDIFATDYFGLAYNNTGNLCEEAACMAEPVVTIVAVGTDSIKVMVQSGEADPQHTFRIELQKDADGDPTTEDWQFYGERIGVAAGMYTFGVNEVNAIEEGPLPCNSRYRVQVREYCDDLSGNSNWFPFPGETYNGANPPDRGIEVYTWAADFAVDVSQDPDQYPTCPGASDGCITVDVTSDLACCANATYDVQVVGGGYDETMAGVPAANFPIEFCGLDGDLVDVIVTEVWGCFLATPQVTTPFDPNDGVDVENPYYYVYDLATVLVASNDPLAPLGNPVIDNYSGDTYDFGTYVLPEGECGRQDFFFVYGYDNCAAPGPGFAGFIGDYTGLVTAVGTTLFPASVDPGTAADVIYDGVFGGPVRVDVHWSAGDSEVVITGCDAANNCVDITLQASVTVDQDQFDIIATPLNVTIPACADSVIVAYGFTIDGGCDAEWSSVNFTSSTGTVFINGFPFINGNYIELLLSFTADDDTPFADFFIIEATNAFGAFTFELPEYTVTQAAEDQPAQINAHDESYTIPSCDDVASAFYSFTVTDDCDEINDAAVSATLTPEGGVAIPLTLDAGQDCDGVGYCKSYTALADYPLPEGLHTIEISYGGISVTHFLDVDQADPQAPTVDVPGNLNVTIPPCEQCVATVWSVQISDDCDADFPTSGLVVSLFGNALDVDDPSQVANLGGGVFEIYGDVCVGDVGDLVVSYTDSEDLSTEASVTINAISVPDEFDPIIIHPSNDIEIEIDPCELSGTTEVCFSLTFTDNCGVVSSSATNNGSSISPDSGNTYCLDLAVVPGTTQQYTIEATATDAAGNETTEDFTIHITQAATPQVNIACNGDLNITLDEGCSATLDADLLLEGSLGCLTEDDFEIVVEDLAGNVISTDGTIPGCGVYNYSIDVDGVSGFPCWGTITAEDKEDPVIVCPDDVDSYGLKLSLVESFGGELSEDDPTYARTFASAPCATSTFADDVYYDVYTFTVTEPGLYVFTANSDVDLYGNLHTADFDPENPCDSWLIGNDDDGPGANPEIAFEFSMTLPQGQYALVLSSFSNGTTGSYTIDIATPDEGGEVIAQAPANFICTDADLLRLDLPTSLIPDSYVVDEDGSIISIDPALEAILDITGYPLATDNCGDIRIHVSDIYTPGGDCGDSHIARSFYATDKENSPCVGDANESLICTQLITIRKPDFNDVMLPPALVELDCDEFMGADNPTPEQIGAIQGLANPEFAYPVVMTALDAEDNDGDGNLYEIGLHPLNDAYCNLGASYVDLPRINVCPGTYKFVRVWTILDWCNPEDIWEYRQVIKVGDYDGPTVYLPPVDYNWDGVPDLRKYSTSPFNCTAYIQLPNPEVTDDCSGAGSVVVSVLNYGGEVIFIGVPGGTFSAQPGGYAFRFCATDGCGNESCLEVPFVVVDEVAPTASCDDELNVSIGGGDIHNGVEGQARIYAVDVDEGSNDNCGPVRVEIRRNYWEDETCSTSANDWSPWGEYIDFYCCDIDNEITIELRVWDDANGDGVVGGPGDLSNVCWMVVTPEDKLNPFCYPPHAVTLRCDELPVTFPGDLAEAYATDFGETSTWMNAIFGEAWGTDNCAVDTIVERTPTINLHDCGWGTITRRFEAWQLEPAGDENNNGAIDASEVRRSTNPCTQLITITEYHDYTIDFPEDASADCGDPNIPGVETEADGCDILAVNVADPERFDATGDECYKLRITYSVINWCLWDGEVEPYVIPRYTGADTHVDPCERPIVYSEGNDAADVEADVIRTCGPDFTVDPDLGYWQYTQFVKVYDSSDPVITVNEFGGPTEECPDLEPGQFGSIDNVNCTAPVSITISVDDECELFDQDGNLVISLVDAYLDAFAFDANGDGEIKAPEFEAQINVSANVTNNGDGTFTFTYNAPIIYSTQGPDIWHAVRFRIEDGCGNQTSETVEFDVVDCKAPTPICINGLTVTLMPQPEGGCAMAIWATDFIASPITDCALPIRYAIYRAADVQAAGDDFEPSQDDTGLVLTQDDDETTIVYIYAIDAEGNFDYCETYLLVQAHESCAAGASPGTIAGVIATEEDETVQDVEVNLSGAQLMSVTTPQEGNFMFANLPAGEDYTVTPYLNANPLNGVSTFDLVLISKHILGVQLLDSPYKMIAADVNNSETISTLDMIKLRKLILNIDTELEGNTSWRFVNASYVFPDPTDPWHEEFPEIHNENNLPEGLTIEADFVGVKVGDVNGNAAANLLSSDDRTLDGQFNFNVADVAMKAGNVYTVEFTGADMAAVEGYQLTIALEGVELVDLVYGLANAEHFGMRFVDEGMITTSWNGEASAEDVLFSLVLRAKADALLSEVVGVSSRYTVAEAYHTNGSTMGVGIEFNTGVVASAGFEVYQNTPNPFKGETLIGFNLPEDAEVTVTINDVTGRTITVLRGDYAAGYNNLNVTREQLNGATGVLSYTLTAGDFTATRKMIVLE